MLLLQVCGPAIDEGCLACAPPAINGEHEGRAHMLEQNREVLYLGLSLQQVTVKGRLWVHLEGTNFQIH